MKKIKLGLFPKVLIAIALGSLLGLIAPDVLVRILKTFNVLFAQILKFIVPLLVLGLVTPSVANLGKGAGKMLIAVMVISYLSTVGAGLRHRTLSALPSSRRDLDIGRGRQDFRAVHQPEDSSGLRHPDGSASVLYGGSRNHIHRCQRTEERL